VTAGLWPTRWASPSARRGGHHTSERRWRQHQLRDVQDANDWFKADAINATKPTGDSMNGPTSPTPSTGQQHGADCERGNCHSIPFAATVWPLDALLRRLKCITWPSERTHQNASWTLLTSCHFVSHVIAAGPTVASDPHPGGVMSPASTPQPEHGSRESSHAPGSNEIP
jgi:hypothetical protein